MIQKTALRRMIEAAEQWGRQQFGVVMTADAVSEPKCSADGSLQTTVELQSAGSQPTRTRCLVILEPNGLLSCIAPDELPP